MFLLLDQLLVFTLCKTVCTQRFGMLLTSSYATFSTVGRCLPVVCSWAHTPHALLWCFIDHYLIRLWRLAGTPPSCIPTSSCKRITAPYSMLLNRFPENHMQKCINVYYITLEWHLALNKLGYHTELLFCMSQFICCTEVIIKYEFPFPRSCRNKCRLWRHFAFHWGLIIIHTIYASGALISSMLL